MLSQAEVNFHFRKIVSGLQFLQKLFLLGNDSKTPVKVFQSIVIVWCFKRQQKDELSSQHQLAPT